MTNTPATRDDAATRTLAGAELGHRTGEEGQRGVRP
ncbi:hypothetical protein P3T27_006157 [Kitasatospora sp. MAA19]|nr:hypothetical protein [Kitasatospora sp. MAA19]